MMAEVKQNVSKIISELPEALAKRSAIIENEKLSRKEKHEALWKLVKEKPRLYFALKAIFHIVRPRRGRHFPRPPFPPHHPIEEGRGPRPFGRPEKRAPNGERKEGKKTEEIKKIVAPVKA
ncbi:hypothetical protein OESDEN_24464 [Oesophagostomum dentatum]|uniref:SXP/RAL-2 family protein Ani s 5-like cation-binding domain-containing protein n=1 Tax=Oesophagostomum dentatum TaxID=61180 RepID=A0A0B1RXH8_OESDE|nr:hypothetical protein OESDEN_24464 [Oesophagostomum dentatum]